MRRRSLGCYRQAVLVIRWCLDGIRIAQLAVDDGIGGLTTCCYAHEGVEVLTACAPEIAEAKAAGHGHLNLDGMVTQRTRSR